MLDMMHDQKNCRIKHLRGFLDVCACASSALHTIPKLMPFSFELDKTTLKNAQIFYLTPSGRGDMTFRSQEKFIFSMVENPTDFVRIP